VSSLVQLCLFVAIEREDYGIQVSSTRKTRNSVSFPFISFVGYLPLNPLFFVGFFKFRMNQP